MDGKNEIIGTVLTIIATAAIVFTGTSAYYLNNVLGKTNIEYVYDGNFAKLKNVLNVVENDFLFDEYTMEDLEDGAIRGMLDALEDPYTSYFNVEESKDFLTETAVGEYEGIGLYITYGTKIEWPMVIGAIKGSTAYDAGVQPGDYIYAIGGEQISSNTSLEEVSTKLKGPAGTKVSVTFIRYDENDNEKEYTVELERKKIEFNPVEYEVKNNDIGYIRFTSFDSGVSEKFKSAYNDLVKNKNVKGIIIDIRDNPGGLLDTVKEIADMLVPSGVITYTVDKNGNKNVEYSDSNSSDVPLVVLVNGNSASASEILASAIKDHGVGKIVGEKTYGKGLVQKLKGLGDGTYIKITIAEYFSPNGTKINKVGVIPDVEVKDDANTKNDEQLEKAIEVIENF